MILSHKKLRTAVNVSANIHRKALNCNSPNFAGSNFVERDCVRSTSRSACLRVSGWCGGGVLRLAQTTPPRSGSN